MDTRIVGRDEELSSIGRFLDSVPDGPAALVLSGQAGIGKTALWQEALRLAEVRSIRLLSCRPARAETRLSYSALEDLLDPVLDDALPALPEPRRRALEVALLRTASKGRAPDQRAVARASLDVLDLVASKTPVIIAIDDAQWLDGPSARVLEFAARRLETEPIGILAAARTDDHPGAIPVGLERALGEDRLQLLSVGPLSLAAIHHLLRSRFGLSLPRHTVVQVHKTAGGNPFFALEIGRALLRKGSATLSDRTLPIPDSLRELVSDRLATLSSSTREVLLVAATLAHPTPASVAFASGEESAKEALDEAQELGVVELESGTVRFTHPLLGSILSSDISAGGRRKLHRRLAEVVSDPEERASHLALGAEGPSEIVAATLDEASKHAAGRGAPDAAAAFSEQALRLTPRPDDQSFRRLIQAMDHHFMVGDMSRSAELAEEFLTTMPAGPRRAALLFRLGVIHGRTGGYSGAEELLSSALAEVGDDAGLRIDVEQELAFTLSASGDMGSALEHARAGLAEAEVSGDARQLATALTSVAGYEFLTGLGVRDDLFHRAEQLDAVAAPGGAGQLLSLAPDVAWGCVLKWADFFERGRRKLEEGYRTFVEQGDESALPFILYQLSELECWAGRWVLAERYAADAVRLAGQSEQEGMLTAALYARGLIDAHRGRVGEARTTLDDALRLCDRTNNLAVAVQTRSVLGFLALSLEDHGRAVEHLGDLADGVAAMGAHEPGTPRFLADAIEASIGIGNLVRADTLVEHLEERGRTLGRPWALATGARCRGLLRAAKGDLEAAVDSFDRAFIEHERLAMPFELGRTHLVAGTVHRRAKRKKVAKQHLTEALAIFERLGAPLWSVKARTEIDRLGLRRTAPLDLTPTERRVAELVADGRTNREVADALFMSVKTVDSNLSRIYRKLGVRSRTELAHGWPASDHAPPAESRDQSEAFS